MNPAEENTQAGRQLGLPMMTYFSVRRSSGRSVAHALHFDLVATATTNEEALAKLRKAVKAHFEYGLRNNIPESDILQNAPQECWDRIKDAPVAMGEEIEIDTNRRIQTLTRTAIDETEPSLATA